MLMTSDHALTLAILLRADKPVTALHIGRASKKYKHGNEVTWRELGKSLVGELTRVKAVHKHGRQPMRYEISERGRIALALWRAKQQRQRHAIVAGSWEGRE
jgi:hypothetical protein